MIPGRTLLQIIKAAASRFDKHPRYRASIEARAELCSPRQRVVGRKVRIFIDADALQELVHHVLADRGVPDAEMHGRVIVERAKKIATCIEALELGPDQESAHDEGPYR